jgi:hypothetical protein
VGSIGNDYVNLQDWITLNVNLLLVIVTLLLVIVTAVYVVLTGWMAKSAKTSADWARQAAEATRDAAQATRRQAELAAGAFPISFKAVLERPLDEAPHAQYAQLFAELDPEIGTKRFLTLRNAGGRVYFHDIGGEAADFVEGKGPAKSPQLHESQKPGYFDPGTQMQFEYSPIERHVEILSMSIVVRYTLEPDDPIRRMPVVVDVDRQSRPGISRPTLPQR